jgi:hypothetical protein
MTTFSFASDLHGDMQDAAAVRQFRGFVEDFKPKVRGFGGDLFDFRALRVGASPEERLESMRADFETGMAFLEWYRPTFLTLGNHDIRLWDRVAPSGLHRKGGPLVDYAEELIGKFDGLTKKLKTAVLPYDKRRGVWSRNGLRFTHGFDRNTAADMAQQYGNVLFGHGHRVEHHPGPPQGRGEPPMARMVGALCRLDLSYNRAQTRTLQQQHGWAYGAFLGKRKHHVMQAVRSGGRVMYAGDFKFVN